MQNLQLHAPLNSEVMPSLLRIEVASFLQIPSFQIVGLPSPEVAEARERIRAAIDFSGLEFPRRRVIVNLSPASVRKQGTGLDLSMALAILSACTPVDKRAKAGGPWKIMAWGELGLDGSIKPTGQVMRSLYSAWSSGMDYLLIPKEDEGAARVKLDLLQASGLFKTPQPKFLLVSSLCEAWQKTLALTREEDLEDTGVQSPTSIPGTKEPAPMPELLALSPSMERLLGVAAAGSHHLLLLGPRGTGKSHALEWLAALQPEPDAASRVEQCLLAEMHGLSFASRKAWAGAAVVRRAGIQVKPAALIGSASPLTIRPGEFSLAHGGLLIADEFPEWARDSREALREPMERGKVTLTRSRGVVEMPAEFALAATGNFCPCGGWPAGMSPPTESETLIRIQACRCSLRAQGQYMERLSGPVLDRIDLVAKVGVVQPGLPRTQDECRRLQEKVQITRNRAIQRYGSAPGKIPSEKLEQLLRENPSWAESLAGLGASSLRSRHKILRTSLSLALWDGEPGIPEPAHFLEAACFRPERLI